MDKEAKKEDDDEEEEIEGKKWDKEDMQDSLVVEEDMIVKYPFFLFFFTIVSFPCSSCFIVLFAKKKLNDHIIEIHQKKIQHHILSGAS